MNDIKNGKYELIFASSETRKVTREVVLQLSKAGVLKAVFVDVALCIINIVKISQIDFSIITKSNL